MSSSSNMEYPVQNQRKYQQPAYQGLAWAPSFFDPTHVMTNGLNYFSSNHPLAVQQSIPAPYQVTTMTNVFTFQQWKEFQLQSQIYECMKFDILVPTKLIMSIMESMRNLRPWHLPKQRDWDQELGRCRRTDGKRWRCSKEVVNGKKYCPRHMNRGQKRSKKNTNQLTEATTSVGVGTTFLPNPEASTSVGVDAAIHPAGFDATILPIAVSSFPTTSVGSIGKSELQSASPILSLSVGEVDFGTVDKNLSILDDGEFGTADNSLDWW